MNRIEGPRRVRAAALLSLLFCCLLLACDDDGPDADGGSSPRPGDGDPDDDNNDAGGDDAPPEPEFAVFLPPVDPPIDPDHPSDEVGVFVAPAGDDAAAGTMADPFRTIARGMTAATSSGKAVFVAGGVYEEVPFVVASMYGGYEWPGWGRDLVRNATVIEARSTVLVEPPDSGVLTVDGFALNGREVAVETRALVVNGGVVSLVNNDIRNAPLSPGVNEVDLYVAVEIVGAVVWMAHSRVRSADLTVDYTMSDAGATGAVGAHESTLYLVDNEIVSGNVTALGGGHPIYPATAAVGVADGDALLANNRITAGSVFNAAGGSTGVSLHGDRRFLMVNNFVQTGFAMVNEAVSVDGDRKGEARARLVDNTLAAAPAGWSTCGVRLDWEVELTLVNNVVQIAAAPVEAAGLCLASVGGKPDQAVSLIHNDIHSTAGAPLLAIGSVAVTDVDALNSCEWWYCADAKGNISAPPRFAHGSRYQLSADSECLDAGVDPTAWVAAFWAGFDLDGDARPQGATWDIGADEFVPSR